MQCPNCSTTELRNVEGENLELDYCPQCRGTWFDRGELEELLKLPRDNFTTPRDARRTAKVCPRCSKPMLGFLYPHTFAAIHMCSACRGLWFDKGMLTEVRNARDLVLRSGVVKEAKEKDRGIQKTLLEMVGITKGRKGGIKKTLLEFVDRSIQRLAFW